MVKYFIKRDAVARWALCQDMDGAVSVINIYNSYLIAKDKMLNLRSQGPLARYDFHGRDLWSYDDYLTYYDE